MINIDFLTDLGHPGALLVISQNMLSHSLPHPPLSTPAIKSTFNHGSTSFKELVTISSTLFPILFPILGSSYKTIIGCN